ncbi:MAG: hypothetical protein II012_00315, partial [Ruminococcus sp.]|nr:hypothetical protein [Ruminococcus sp.]
TAGLPPAQTPQTPRLSDAHKNMPNLCAQKHLLLALCFFVFYQQQNASGARRKRLYGFNMRNRR